MIRSFCSMLRGTFLNSARPEPWRTRHGETAFPAIPGGRLRQRCGHLCKRWQENLMQPSPFNCASFVAAVVGLALAAALPQTVATSTRESPPSRIGPAITVEIASPENHQRRIIAIDQPFLVVVTNVSPQPLRIWRDWCSW